MNSVKCLPLEKIKNRPEIKQGIINYVQKNAIPDILNCFFSFLDCQSLASCDLVCKQWHNLTDHKPINDPLWNQAIAKEIHQHASFIFGKVEWNKYFGDIGNAPNYPRDICKILASNCPFFEGKAVGKTHMFVLVPETVNGDFLSLNFLGELVKDPKEGTKTGYDENECWPHVFEEYGKKTVEKAHWILITDYIIFETRKKFYTTQQKMVEKVAYYKVPNVLEAVLTVFIKCVSSGKFLLGKDPLIYTRCQGRIGIDEYPVIVGGFGPSGLTVGYNNNHDFDNIAVLARRRFGFAEVLTPTEVRTPRSSKTCTLF